MVKITEKKFAYGSTEKTIHVFDFFEEIGILEGHENDVNALARVSDVQILSGSEDATIRLWEIKDFTCLKVFRAHEEGIDLCRLVMLDSERFIQLFANKC